MMQWAVLVVALLQAATCAPITANEVATRIVAVSKAKPELLRSISYCTCVCGKYLYVCLYLLYLCLRAAVSQADPSLLRVALTHSDPDLLEVEHIDIY